MGFQTGHLEWRSGERERRLDLRLRSRRKLNGIERISSSLTFKLETYNLPSPLIGVPKRQHYCPGVFRHLSFRVEVIRRDLHMAPFSPTHTNIVNEAASRCQ